MSRIKRMTLLLAGIAGATAVGPAFAQSAIEEIRVTAERREADIQDVPLAVSAYSQEQLEKLQITEGRDLQRYVPSLNMFNNITHPSNLSLSLRGGLQQDASLVVAESPVGIYVDDVYVGRLNGNNVRLSDIERVEVLRGPQGTLYGRNTGYGAIKYVSRTPGEDAWFDATLGAGNEEQLVARASVGGPLGGDGFAGSLAAQWTEKDGEWYNLAENDDRGNEENSAVRGKLRYTGIDRLDAILTVSYAKAENDSLQLMKGITPDVPSDRQFTTDDLVFIEGLDENGDPVFSPNGEYNVNTNYQQLAPAPLGDRPKAETEQTLIALSLAYDISDSLTFKSVTGYVGTDDLWHTDFGGNSAAQATFTGSSDTDSDQITQEFQLLGQAFGERMNYILGAFYMNEDSQQLFGWHFVSPLSQSLIDVETDSYALFGQADYSVTERLKVTAGLRWTKDEKDFQFDFERFAGNFFDLLTCTPPFVCSDAPGFFPAVQTTIDGDTLGDSDWEEWTPKIGVDYQLEDVLGANSLLLYAQAAKGYKGGGYSAIALASTDPVGVYDPEINWTYEGGIKADWFGSRLRTNIVYFFSDIEDIQQNSTANAAGGAFEFPVDNVADAEIQGVEFEFSAVPIDGLNLFMSGAWLDGKYKNLKPGSAADNALEDYGVEAQTPQTPDYQVSIGFDYTFDFPGELIGDFSFGADYYEIDDYVTAATNDFYNSGWDIWNAFVSAEIGDNWEAKLTGKNLADDFIITSGSRGLGGFIALYPREYLFTLTYRYGK